MIFFQKNDHLPAGKNEVGSRFSKNPLPAQRFFFKVLDEHQKIVLNMGNFLKLGVDFRKIPYLLWFWIFFSGPPTSPNFQTHKKIFLHTFTPIRFLFKVCLKTYKSFIKIKGPKTDHFTSLHSLHFTSLTHFTHSLTHSQARG